VKVELSPALLDGPVAAALLPAAVRNDTDAVTMIFSMKTPTSFTLASDVRGALERLADSQDRSRSWLVNDILREGLTARGALLKSAIADCQRNVGQDPQPQDASSEAATASTRQALGGGEGLSTPSPPLSAPDRQVTLADALRAVPALQLRAAREHA
jgi:hypothetical protein